MASLVEINEYELDREWVQQPRLFLKYARQLADAKQGQDLAKAEMDVARAEVEIQIRKNPVKYGLEKVTEKMVEATVEVHKRVRLAVQALASAKHKADMLQAVVNALEHRKKALENLVFLHGQSYFAQPRVKAGSGEAGEGAVNASKNGARKKVRYSKGNPE